MTEATFRWGADAVDPSKPNLPALKARFLLDRAPLTGKVVEIGSGDGKLLRTLKRHKPDLELFGCDIREPATPPEVYAFRKMDDDLPFETGSLDAVLIFDVLEHVPDPEWTLSEAARVLRPGGRLLAFVPVEGETVSFYEIFRRVLGKDTYALTKEHIQAFTHDGLRRMIEKKFVISELRYAYHVLGHMMDATFFAAQRMAWLKNFWWKENVYYNKPKASPSAASAAMNRMLELGNLAAWAESTLLSRSRFGSAGILVEAQVRSRLST